MAEAAAVTATEIESETPATTNTVEPAAVTKKNDLIESSNTDKVSVAEPTEPLVVDKDTIIIQVNCYLITFEMCGFNDD